ncbi:hypothetical protein BRAO375_690004 [Bradyrhizobium sp. ORS 375]|nr:hypothetical protein BRAO375_690004 [Bradyrhizobium sp. ORS 375]
MLTKSSEDLRPYAFRFCFDPAGYGQLIGFGGEIPYRAG